MTPTTRPPRPARSSLGARLFVTLVTIAAIALFVAAGNWQRDRMHAKEAERAEVERAAALPAVPLPRTDDWAVWRHRRVVASGTWRGGAQLLVDNRVHAGRAGFDVVTPLALDDGRVVLVDRGWIVAGAGATRVPEVAAPSGRATVAGTRRDSAGALRRARPRRRRRQRVAEPRSAPHRRDDRPRAPADRRRAGSGRGRRTGWCGSWPAPDAGVDTHRSYMWQWYAFAALAAALWIGFALRRWRRAP